MTPSAARTSADAPATRRQAGSAVVEFALISVLALIVALALVQLAIFLYQRNVVLTAVAEGARVGATAGRDAAAGRETACTLLRQALGDRCERLRVQAIEREGLVVVSADGTLASFVPLVPDLRVRLSARMHDEDALVPVTRP